ncbi:MAG: PecA family PE domain-processing aspartic protease [Mycobacterium sp.]|uniref:PecA family PE domain-processing aspartic protease n=1 Tax=Mycobacterium sp. TaxID=1785 RepID=UPI003C4C6653
MATAPSAHADVEDIFQPVIDAIAQAINVVDPSLASSLDPGLDVGSIAAALPAAAVENATIPLTMVNTDPEVDISIAGGPDIPVVADTGSVGLMVPWNDVGLPNLFTLFSNLSHLTFETTGYGASPAGPNIDILYVQDPDTTVSFGNGIVTNPTTVDLALFAYPASNSDLFNLYDYSLPGYLHSVNADGFLGLGAEPTLVGPPGNSVITALPGDLSEGVLINETGGYLEFGPNPLSVYTSLLGAPLTEALKVSVGGGGYATVDVASFDSGGTDGTIPADILVGNPAVGQPLSSGTEISVYTSNGDFLYSYVTSAAHSPTISSDPTMNTGWAPFQAYPVYISYSPTNLGTIVFDY